jgi:hypothetical protein
MVQDENPRPLPGSLYVAWLAKRCQEHAEDCVMYQRALGREDAFQRCIDSCNGDRVCREECL